MERGGPCNCLCNGYEGWLALAAALVGLVDLMVHGACHRLDSVHPVHPVRWCCRRLYKCLAAGLMVGWLA